LRRRTREGVGEWKQKAPERRGLFFSWGTCARDGWSECGAEPCWAGGCVKVEAQTDRVAVAAAEVA